MNRERFYVIIGEVIAEVKGLIEEKNTNNYATEDDALHNFRMAAADQNVTMAQALRGMAAKHKVIVDDMASGAIVITEKRIKEHAIDLIVYAALLIPVLYEMMEEQETVVSVVNECDNCSEQDAGYDRAVDTLTGYALHLKNTNRSDKAYRVLEGVEELRKER